MIVVHPLDPSTRMLEAIYRGLDDVKLFDSGLQKSEIERALARAPKDEPVLLLGHGYMGGLLDMRYGKVVGHECVPYLRDRENLVGIWCYASTFASEAGLKGFFSGMFISELPEAVMNGVDAAHDEIQAGAEDFSERFGDMLRAGMSIREAARELCDPKYITSPLTEFNYSRLTYRVCGNEPLPVPELWDL